MSPLLIVGLSLGTGIKLMVAPRLVVRFLLFRHAARKRDSPSEVADRGADELDDTGMVFVLGILAHGIIPQAESQFYFQNTDEVVPYLVENPFRQFLGSRRSGWLSVGGAVVDRLGPARGRLGAGGRCLGELEDPNPWGR